MGRSRPVDRKFAEFEYNVDGVEYIVPVRFLSNRDGSDARFSARCEELDLDVEDHDVNRLRVKMGKLVDDRGSIEWRKHLLITTNVGPGHCGVDFAGYKVGEQKDGRTAYMPTGAPQAFYDPTRKSVEEVLQEEWTRGFRERVQYRNPRGPPEPELGPRQGSGAAAVER